MKPITRQFKYADFQEELDSFERLLRTRAIEEGASYYPWIAMHFQARMLRNELSQEQNDNIASTIAGLACCELYRMRGHSIKILKTADIEVQQRDSYVFPLIEAIGRVHDGLATPHMTPPQALHETMVLVAIDALFCVDKLDLTDARGLVEANYPAKN